VSVEFLVTSLVVVASPGTGVLLSATEAVGEDWVICTSRGMRRSRRLWRHGYGIRAGRIPMWRCFVEPTAGQKNLTVLFARWLKDPICGSPWRPGPSVRSTSCVTAAKRALTGGGRSDVRQYFGPAPRVDFGSIALASLRLTSGGLRREHAGPDEGSRARFSQHAHPSRVFSC
jgi:hypothetical protein